eukprot:CAMPEP_0170174834 /NCGR_PEP_ID=MMETSP0040_2-20121228/8025_1 /TAXON_ID=641309 /ORGANISM="Lotharella oceanica, Strain CCMP622" /LENGTH=159 /DNA_ID=CAMNT_0010416627 /DNA_START=112 /DNA_END=592 /DNA_ORIENTATION=-
MTLEPSPHSDHRKEGSEDSLDLDATAAGDIHFGGPYLVEGLAHTLDNILMLNGTFILLQGIQVDIEQHIFLNVMPGKIDTELGHTGASSRAVARIRIRIPTPALNEFPLAISKGIIIRFPPLFSVIVFSVEKRCSFFSRFSLGESEPLRNSIEFLPRGS